MSWNATNQISVYYIREEKIVHLNLVKQDESQQKSRGPNGVDCHQPQYLESDNEVIAHYEIKWNSYYFFFVIVAYIAQQGLPFPNVPSHCAPGNQQVFCSHLDL